MRQQAEQITSVASRLDERFVEAVSLLQHTRGRVVVAGVGKSGQVGCKLASTLSSTGTPAFFVNAAEAAHGDLGMITEDDTVILISYSGKTEEVLRMLPRLRDIGATTIALVGNQNSPLGRSCNIALDVSVDREACPNNLAPTTSSLATLAMGDALAVALMRRRRFGAHDFAQLHPGGSLGDRLSRRVGEVMRRRSTRVPGWDLPIVSPASSVTDCLLAMTEGRLGLVLVMEDNRLLGILTDGDLRRSLHRHGGQLQGLDVRRVMTPNPMTVGEDVLLGDAYELMIKEKVTALVVVDHAGDVSGVVQVFDVE
ncbi:MAG: KpsF/GutQ family sugar-phosphate isomerase [Myxococcota bacterium]